MADGWQPPPPPRPPSPASSGPMPPAPWGAPGAGSQPPFGTPPPAQVVPASVSRAKRLAATSGMPVLGPTGTMLDTSVTVFVARPIDRWPDFSVFDHTGVPLGSIALSDRRPGESIFYDFPRRRGREYRFGEWEDTWENDPRNRVPRNRIDLLDVNGAVQGSVLATNTMAARVHCGFEVEVSGRQGWGASFGLTFTLAGRDIGTVSSEHFSDEALDLRDHAGNGIGRLYSEQEHRKGFEDSDSFVLGVDPAVGPPLRPFLAAVPLLIAIRRWGDW